MNTTTHDTELADRLDEVASFTGGGTELVTVSIPPDTSLQSIRDRIRSEHAHADNIKSDRTRDHVQRSLNRVDRILRTYEETPENGLVVFAGIPDTEDDIVSYTFDNLPNPVQSSTYTCDDHFDTSIIPVDTDDTYGLVIVERGQAIIGETQGDDVRVVKSVDSQVMGKTRAGGQSAQRFARERERQTHEFFEQIARITKSTFITDNELIVAGVVIGGTTGTVESFINESYLDHRLRDRVYGPYSVEYANETGLRALVSKAQNDIVPPDVREGIERVSTFFTAVRDGNAAYGFENVREAVTYGAVDTLLVSENTRDERVLQLRETVENHGGDVVIVPTGIEDGARFDTVFSGVGAILRFQIN